MKRNFSRTGSGRTGSWNHWISNQTVAVPSEGCVSALCHVFIITDTIQR